jgi:transposase
LDTGLIAGDPDQGRTRASELITNLRGCPIPEIAKLGRTLHAWRTELLAYFDHPVVSNGPTENLNLKIKITKTNRPRLPEIHPLRLRLLLTTAESTKITHRHGSEPAVPGSLRRAG